jgi:hypothetical protein
MRRAEDGAGIAEADRAHVYRRWPAKESRKYASTWRRGSPATERQWTWVGDDSVFKKYGAQLGLVVT